MPDYDNTNTGILSRNPNRTEEKHAEYTGSLDVGGEAYFIDAWVRERKDGSGKFFSLRVKRKQAAAVTAKPKLLDDEIPF